MANRAGGLLDDDTSAPAAPQQAAPQQAAPTSSNRASGLTNEPATAPTAPSGNSIWYDMVHPQDADLSRPQTWRDWLTRTYTPSAKDVGSSALDDVSFGTADWAQSKLTGESVDAIRARTAASQQALGPMGPVLNALTYAVPGGGEVKAFALPGKFIGKAAQTARPYVGRYGAAALEGGVAGGGSSVGHQLGEDMDWTKVLKDAAISSATGVGGQAVGDVTAPVPNRTMFGPLRQRAAAGEDIGLDLQGIRTANNYMPPETAAAANQALDDVEAASRRSTANGPLVNRTAQAANLGMRLANFHWTGIPALFGANPGEVIRNASEGLNTASRNRAIQGGFDQIEHLYTGQSPQAQSDAWANILRQGWIGGSR